MEVLFICLAVDLNRRSSKKVLGCVGRVSLCSSLYGHLVYVYKCACHGRLAFNRLCLPHRVSVCQYVLALFLLLASIRILKRR